MCWCCLRRWCWSLPLAPTSRYCNHDNVAHDVFAVLAKYLQLHPEVLQKGKWLFVPGVGSKRTAFTADMTEEQIDATNEHDTGWFKAQLDDYLRHPDVRTWLEQRGCYDTLSDLTAHSWRKLAKTYFASHARVRELLLLLLLLLLLW